MILRRKKIWGREVGTTSFLLIVCFKCFLWKLLVLCGASRIINIQFIFSLKRSLIVKQFYASCAPAANSISGMFFYNSIFSLEFAGENCTLLMHKTFSSSKAEEKIGKIGKNLIHSLVHVRRGFVMEIFLNELNFHFADGRCMWIFL